METGHAVVKALHIIAFTAWMAGMFYLPRLYAYHAEAGLGSPQAATFERMEERLLRIIMNPALIATWALGLTLVFAYGAVNLRADGWFHVKVLLVLLMTGFHGMLAKWRKDFTRGGPVRSSRFYRLVNEVPTLLLIGIVLLAVVRPF